MTQHPHPITSHAAICDYLATQDPAVATNLAAAAIKGVAAAGALEQWDSGTIEGVLAPLIGPVAAAGLPPFLAQDEAAQDLWATILEMRR
ncbi:hypothetical protein [Citricoccus nitrophenolicus]|uniref:hypothetical protein n=1 Tax=Citricoccus nitrophenolicus TaxID=863575 RepID=UPI00360CC476